MAIVSGITFVVCGIGLLAYLWSRDSGPDDEYPD